VSKWVTLPTIKKLNSRAKKDQIVGTIQRDYGNSWPVRHSRWIFAGTAVAILATVLAVLFSRRVFGTEA
jgi:hypothetical protein